MIPAAVTAEQPDLVVFTGDSINEPAASRVFQETMNRLAKIAPTFAVKGNWDTSRIFEGAGAKELDGQAHRVEIRGVPIWIAGLAADNAPGLGKALNRIPAGEFVVLLYHYPDILAEAADHHVDLYCAGHTHGGQVALPFYGAIITLSRFGKRYEAGLFQKDGTWMYVNRGIGMEGGFAPRVRFWAPPELTVIEIRPSPR